MTAIVTNMADRQFLSILFFLECHLPRSSACLCVCRIYGLLAQGQTKQTCSAACHSLQLPECTVPLAWPCCQRISNHRITRKVYLKMIGQHNDRLANSSGGQGFRTMQPMVANQRRALCKNTEGSDCYCNFSVFVIQCNTPQTVLPVIYTHFTKTCTLYRCVCVLCLT